MSHVRNAHAHRSFTLPFLGLAALVVRRYRDRQQMNALLGMEDYMLKDIGVSRGDLQREATRPLWR